MIHSIKNFSSSGVYISHFYHFVNNSWCDISVVTYELMSCLLGHFLSIPNSNMEILSDNSQMLYGQDFDLHQQT